MNRPQKLPLKTLKRHINKLLKENNIEVKWGRDGTYNHEEHKVYCPFIKSVNDYLTCLHEIGHALTYNTDKYDAILDETGKRIVQCNDELKRKRHTKYRVRIINDELERILSKLTSTLSSLKSNKWKFKWETIAWKFAYQNSLVWNDECSEFVKDCITTYWANSGDKENWSSEKLMDSYFKFRTRYMDPIFTE